MALVPSELWPATPPGRFRHQYRPRGALDPPSIRCLNGKVHHVVDGTAAKGFSEQLGFVKSGEKGHRTSVKELRRHRERQLAEAAKLGIDPSGFVFTNRRGQPLNPDHLYREFIKAATAAGLPPIRLHDLRPARPAWHFRRATT